MLHFDLDDMLSTKAGRGYFDDNSLQETAKYLIEAHDRGSFREIGMDLAAFKGIAKEISKARGGVKKKALIEPIRLCLTTCDHGPSMAEFLRLLGNVDDNMLCEIASLDDRLDQLRQLVQ